MHVASALVGLLIFQGSAFGSSPHRHLLSNGPAPRGVAPAANCGNTINDTTILYENCQPADIGLDYNVFWTVKPSKSTDMENSTLQIWIGLDAAQADGWIGLGFPKIPGEMLGANAVIVSTNATTDSGAQSKQYLLSSRSFSKFQEGQLNITDMVTQHTKDRLQASFTLELPSTTVSQGSVPTIFATGPLTKNGGLGTHDQRGQMLLSLGPA